MLENQPKTSSMTKVCHYRRRSLVMPDDDEASSINFENHEVSLQVLDSQIE